MIDWDNICITVMDSENVLVETDQIYTMDAENRMITFAGKPGPAGPPGQPGPVGNAVWGSITGTLSNQTDLQDALDAKANTADLGTMSAVDDAPSDNKEYARKNGDWSEVSGGGGGGTDSGWMDVVSTVAIGGMVSGHFKYRVIGKIVQVSASGLLLASALSSADPLEIGEVDFDGFASYTAVGAEIGGNIVTVSGSSVYLIKNPTVAEIPITQQLAFTITYMV